MMGWQDELLNGLQAASNAVAGNVAGPVDLINLGLGKIGLPVSAEPLGGSAWMRRQGLMRDVRPGASQVVGETAGLLGPALTAAYAPQIARGLLAAEEAMPVGSAGQTAIPNQRGIFAGTKAQSANLKALEQAQGRIARGDDPAKVWAETGWGKGPDGKWRFEIPDNAVPTKIDINETALLGYPKIDAVFGHKELFTHYPSTQNLVVSNSLNKSQSGAYLPEQGVVELTVPIKGLTNPATNRAATKTAIHELQHAVQQIEGFSAGGSPEKLSKEYSNARAKLNLLEKNEDYARATQQLDDLWDKVWSGKVSQESGLAQEKQLLQKYPSLQEANSLMNVLRGTSQDGYSAYMRLGGEAEARLAQARMNMTPAQRAAQYPWEQTYFREATGVPVYELINRP